MDAAKTSEQINRFRFLQYSLLDISNGRKDVYKNGCPAAPDHLFHKGGKTGVTKTAEMIDLNFREIYPRH